MKEEGEKKGKEEELGLGRGKLEGGRAEKKREREREREMGGKEVSSFRVHILSCLVVSFWRYRYLTLSFSLSFPLSISRLLPFWGSVLSSSGLSTSIWSC